MSVVTNLAAGMAPEPLSHAETLAASSARRRRPRAGYLRAALPEIARASPDLAALIERARSATADAALARRAVALIDLTSLRGGETREEIEALCRRAPRSTARPPSASIADSVRRLGRLLAGSAVRLATVANFPHGGDDIAAVAAEETAAAVAARCRRGRRGGADRGHPRRRCRSGRRAGRGLPGCCRRRRSTLKLILETGVLAASRSGSRPRRGRR